nr:hypothetical protein [Micromonospora sp. DSM 115978]
DGFLPVVGRRETTTTSARWRGLYCCLRCGRVVCWPTREIVGHLDFADLELRHPTRPIRERVSLRRTARKDRRPWATTRK